MFKTHVTTRGSEDRKREKNNQQSTLKYGGQEKDIEGGPMLGGKNHTKTRANDERKTGIQKKIIMQRQSIKDLDRKRCDQDERENEMNKKK